MQKLITALKLLTAGLFAISTAACTTTSIDKTYDFQGKVWEGEVYQQFINTSEKNDHFSEEFKQKTHFSLEHEVNARLARVYFRDGQMSRMTYVRIPDQIELLDLEKGAIVDFILQPGPLYDFSTYQVTRILKLVCRAKDEACIKKEKSEGRFSKVVDADPGDASAKYGVTYNRRNSPEDYAKFK